MNLKIEEKRKAAGIKQGDFAQKIGAKQTAVCNWETNRSDPPVKYLPKIAEVLGCSIDELFPKEATE